MLRELDHTTRARILSIRFPVLHSVIAQASFWILAYGLLGFIIYMASLNMSHSFNLNVAGSVGANILMGLTTGLLYGIAMGLLDYFFDRSFFRNKPLGKTIILKSILSLLVLILCFAFLRYVLFSTLVGPLLIRNQMVIDETTWRNIFLLVLVYSFWMTLVITFILQVNKKYGPGVLMPLLLGKYRNPREEERVFMFMDLKSSTTIAEALGHIRYSGFIRHRFMAINHMLNAHNAEVYQYVGDEIVISWRVNSILKYAHCIQFFFACQEQFLQKGDYYREHYGFIPEFKAGLHMGRVTAVEIGEIKRDIAYHGDTLNTAARIQSMCNEYGKKLLVSAHFMKKAKLADQFKIEELGTTLLKGKTLPVEIVSIEALSF